MQITHAQISVPDAHATANFFEQVLGLPTSRDSARASIQVGASRLELDTDAGVVGHHHLAFLIPDTSFGAAKRLLLDRVSLLQADGRDEIEASGPWNARSLYFEAPDGTVLELIARRDLVTPTRGLGPADVLSISEVGVAVTDVSDAVLSLARSAAIGLYAQTMPGADFSPVGDIDGLLILVSEGRPWFPTADRIARDQHISLAAVAPIAGEYRLADHVTLSITSP